MALTYDQFIEKTRMRGFEFLHGTRYFEKGVVYDALHDAIRHVFHVTKQHETSASLSLVAGTRDYTISSAIASDVDSITYVTIDTGEIEPRTLRAFQDEIHFDEDDEDDIVSGTPEVYRVFNGVMRVYPTPSANATATVFYSKKIAPDFYTTAIGTTTTTLKDEYVETVIYEALAILAEAINPEKANYFRSIGRMKFEEARDYATVDAVEPVKYHQPM